MKKKIIIGIIVVAILIIIANGQIALMIRLRNNVKAISFPANIEKIAIRSAFGDSGGNGDYSTVRVVVLVKTELDRYEIRDTIDEMNLRFTSGLYKYNGNVPNVHIYPCEDNTHSSARGFELHFKELDNVADFSDYYFLEFIQSIF